MSDFPKKLFTTDPKKLVWAVSKGGHVAHIVDPAEEKKEYKECLLLAKAYLCASGRAEQQEALRKFKLKSVDYIKKHDKDEFYDDIENLG